MDTRTGEMMDWEEAEKRIKKNLLAANFIKEIPNQFLPQIEGMNREERRRWYKENRKALDRAKGQA